MLTKYIAVAAVALTTALAAPAAIAKPAEWSPDTDGGATPVATHDLRSPDARDAGQRDDLRTGTPTSPLAGTTSATQDLRSADATDAARGIVVAQVEPTEAPAVSENGFAWTASITAAALLALFGMGAVLRVRSARQRRRTGPFATSR
jgi:hypothetical protein